MNRIKMLEKVLPYQVTYLVGKRGDAGAKKRYTKKVFASDCGTSNRPVISQVLCLYF